MVDVTVVGSGPNGLAAAVVAARAGLEVLVLEAAEAPGGAARTAELTLPGFRHDVGSAVHPAAYASPFLRTSGIASRIDWIVPELSYAHPLAGSRAALAWRDLDRTAWGLGQDGRAWRRLLAPLVERIGGVIDVTGHQPLRWPADPIAAGHLVARALEQGTVLAGARFRGEDAEALLTGVMAHVAGRQPSLVAAGGGLLLAAHAHAGGWPIPRGGSQAVVDALLADLAEHGGRVETSRRVESLDELAPSRAVLLDTAPGLLLRGRAGRSLPPGFARALRRYRYGPGTAKVDLALSGPVPWTNPEVGLTPTVHLGGSRAQIRAAEASVARGRMPGHPYVLLVQPSVLDASRVPVDRPGAQTLWAYTHVPAGSTLDATELVLAAVERVAPGVRDLVLAGAATSAAALARLDPTLVGGDLAAGALTLRQLVARPVVSTAPWRTPLAGVYLCSAATPPGPAVHGMNGWLAARLVLRERFGIEVEG